MIGDLVGVLIIGDLVGFLVVAIGDFVGLSDVLFVDVGLFVDGDKQISLVCGTDPMVQLFPSDSNSIGSDKSPSGTGLCSIIISTPQKEIPKPASVPQE